MNGLKFMENVGKYIPYIEWIRECDVFPRKTMPGTRMGNLFEDQRDKLGGCEVTTTVQITGESLSERKN